MDVGRLMRYLRSTEEARANTMSFETNEFGQILIRPIVGDTDRTFTRFAEARSYVRDTLGLSKADIFGADSPMFGGPTFMRHVAKDFEHVFKGAEVKHLAFKFDDAMDMEEMLKMHTRDDKFFGLLVHDNEKARLTRVLLPDGRELSTDQIMEFLRKTRGLTLEMPESSKLGKRMKAFVTEKMPAGFEMFTDKPLVLGVYDATSEMEMTKFTATIHQKLLEEQQTGSTAIFDAIKREAGDEVTDIASAVRYEVRKAIDFANDGISVGSQRMFDDLLKFHKQYSEELAGPLLEQAQNSGDEMLVRRLLREKEVIDTHVDELQGIISRKSGVFNVRASGLDVNMLGDAAKLKDLERDLRQKGFMVKGNVIYDATNKLKALGVDMLTHYTNPKFEAGMALSEIDQDLIRRLPGARTRGSYLTAVPFQSGRTIVDVQTASSYPDLYTRQLLEEAGENLLDVFQETIESVRTKRRVPRLYADILESQARSHDPIVRERAQRMQDFIDANLSLADDPHIMKNLTKNIAESLTKDKGGLTIPQMVIPDSFRAEVVPYHMVRGHPGVGEMDPDFVRFDQRGHRWIIHESDAITVGPAWGGYDFDDALNNMIRYDRENRQIKAIMTRQPNARGEWALFNMYRKDDAVIRIVSNTAKRDTYDSAVKLHNKVERRIKDLQAQPIVDNAKLTVEESKLARIEGVMDSILEEVIRPIEDRLPFRRGFAPTGEFLGYHEIFLEQKGDVRFYRYAGEPEELAYMAATGDKQGVKQALHTMGREDRYKAFRGMLQRLEDHMGAERGILGTYANARMFYDHWHANYADTLRQTAQGRDILSGLTRFLMEQEEVIDAYIQSGREGIGPNTVRTLAAEMIEKTVEASALAVNSGLVDEQNRVVGAMDRVLYEAKGRNREAVEKGLESAGKKLKKSIGIESLFLDATDDRATISVFEQVANQLKELSDKFVEEVGYPEHLLDMQDVRASRRATSDALSIIKSHRDAVDRLTPARITREAAEQMDLSHLATGLLDENQFLREVSNEMLEAVSHTFDQGVAGPRTYRAMVRAAQMIEEMPTQPYHILSSMHRAGLYQDMLSWVENIRFEEGVKGAEFREIAHKTIADVYDEVGSVFRHGRGVREVMQEALRGSEVTTEMLESVTRAIERAGVEGPVFVPDEIRRRFGEARGATILPYGGVELRGPMSPDALVRMREGDQPFTSMGDLVRRYMRGEKEVASHIQEAAANFHNVMSSWLDDSAIRMPVEIEQGMLRALEQAPGTTAAQRARHATEQSVRVADYKRFGMGDFLSSPGGRKLSAGAALLAGIALIHTIRKKKDHTINDMQGPAFMPGGNPYGDGFPNVTPDTSFSYNDVRQPDGFGTTYQVRTRGGAHDQSFVNAINNITGGDIRSTIYEGRKPLQIDQERNQILRSYR